MRRRRTRIHFAASHEASSFRLGIKWIFITLSVLLFFCVTAFFFVATKWNDQGNLVLATPGENGDILLYTLRPGNLTILTIPHDVQLVTGRGLGEWPAESVWKLGHDEKVGGYLLASSITRSFFIPVTAWGSPVANLLMGGPVDRVRFVLTPFETNLTFPQKLQIVWQLSKLQSADIEQVDAQKIGLVTEDLNGVKRAKTGTERVLAAIFATTNVSKNLITVGVVDATGGGTRAVPLLSNVLGVLGMKVVSVDRRQEGTFICQIRGNSTITILVSRVFGCENKGNDAGSFDVEVTLGKDFEQQY